MSFAAVDMPLGSNYPKSGAVSPVACYVDESAAADHGQLGETYTYGLIKGQALPELLQVYEECQIPNWDGYGAEAISPEALFLTNRLLSNLPLGFPSPSVGAEPDGQVTLEWHRSPWRTISLSISPEGDIHYAALIGPANKAYGTEYFIGEMPKTIMDLINRVLA